MRQSSAKTAAKEMLPEYDFSTGVRGTNVVVLEPDVASFFPTPKR